ncbi:bifunctional polysaccharide deacetylase/glycosyltransferase family 2 protein [Actinoplanes derwentensis]|uniref:Glycosyltransferase, catalytic subunit of cellulose synthase and poly-beta-1,6-N-acetylglucosamine synthase n=1 Tax=Actinoplanes derwentensis TaxID=113562 RepID=A0A1H2D0D2_9ACTN|nr:bifunctional polysaccharide deacetylase/glycosyltransferase family 2 protein [Actinoplanes derwentensis]GID85858.1 bi-functional transferase/deacetylase [Actinoplanes derwentensis]SDT76238.1 Glycosyltransferase, catalytic subunit of cellulose synthase and poly-beta-1,6-N-acetylglucosamine synthase [Actinoplanes derwentensis]
MIARRRVLPRPRVLLGVLLAASFLSVLVVQAYINAEFTGDHVESEVGDQAAVPPAILDGGPIINTTGGQESTSRLPDRTIALTFDDGPDPAWTPKILDVLRRHDAHATFFVVGSQVARHPTIAKEIVTGGNELGLHTFTHPNMQRLAPWRRELELSQTQMAIAKATGARTHLARFPYSSKNAAIDEVNWRLVQEAGALGYLVVVNDTDSEDWKRPGVEKIIQNATPAGDRSAVMLFHDAGGDRSQTVAALDEFIPRMKARGYRFTTVTEGLNLTIAGQAAKTHSPLPLNPAAPGSDKWRGTALIWTVNLADGLVALIAGLFLVVGTLTVGRTLLLLVLATRNARQRRSPAWTWGPPVTEPVSVIVPAYNEKEGIEAAVRSLAGGDHTRIEVVVVDDGSTDGTADLVDRMRLPNVRVVRVPNGGKPNALNTGVALARHDLIVMVDGDTVFEPDSLRLLVQPFADPTVGAVAGNVKVGNRETTVALWQHIEYVIGFNLDRRLYEVMNCMPTVPGAIGAFRRTALAQVGGVSDETLAEDTDVTMAMCRAGWRVVYEEKARAWTEAPTTMEQLYRQRYRWSYGTMQAMWKHRGALLDSGPSGRFGRVGLPFLALFGLALPMLAPVVDIMLVYGLVFWELGETVAAWFGMLALQLFTAAVAFRLDRESYRPLLRLPLQQFAYRQLMYLVLLQSATTALTGGRLRWHKLNRAGLAPRSPALDRTAADRGRVPVTPITPSRGPLTPPPGP